MKRSHLIVVTASLSVVLLGVGAWTVLPRGSAICRENYDRLTAGMSLREVEDILGGPARDASTGPISALWSHGATVFESSVSTSTIESGSYSRIWYSDSAAIVIEFSPEWTLSDTTFTPVYRDYDGLWGTVRRWMCHSRRLPTPVNGVSR